MNVWKAAAILEVLAVTAGFIGWKVFYYRKREKLREEVRNAN